MVNINDPQLRESLERHRPVLENAEGRLDSVSADIKAVEQFLIETVQEEVFYEMSGGLTSCPEIDDQSPGMAVFLGGEYIEGEFEHLAFVRFKGGWRLTFRRTHSTGHFAMDYPTPVWTDETEIEFRPLIETKAEVRVRALRVLPKFLEAVARQVSLDDDDYDATVIPF
ncbi:MAG: hypothetical protein RL885_18890 [Planctomycetota bacterium]